jgi:hypothetical protein
MGKVTRRDIEKADKEANEEPDRYCPTCRCWYPASSTAHEGH